MRINPVRFLFTSLRAFSFLLLLTQTAPDARAAPDAQVAPADLDELKAIDFKSLKTAEEGTLDLRKAAMRDAAFSFGARSALARRTWQIQQEISAQTRYLDKIWRFEALVIPQPGNFFLIPPIVTEATNAVALKKGGRLAAASDRAIRIVQHARIALVSPHWRDYLERAWGAALAPPPAALHPKDKSEKKWWDQHLDAGWIEGIKQADEIFLSDLARLKRDFTGMVLYRSLRVSNMISAPYTFLENKGVVGGGDEVLIGERTIRITGDSGLNPDASVWLPLEETLIQGTLSQETSPPETLFQEILYPETSNGEVSWTTP